MNFFAYQDQARSNTRKLVVLFLCAVLALIVITSFLVIGILFYAENQGQVGLNTEFLSSTIFIQVSLVVLAVVTIGTLYRMAQLRGGGRAVAEAMGGRLLNTSTRDLDERKILNVVEEMAIASGTPVPSVYLMEDESINAFAAGYQPRDAVIGITRGCIRELSRDELQGVVAHEFSHIFNGDMRLNIRLMGLLYGIMVIGLIGYHILRGNRYRVSGSSRSGKGAGGGVLLLAVGLMAVGYGGTFFGNLIKSAVSRQREFLADASAVQYTRNPDGISGALKKIGGYSWGTEIRSTNASEISHMLFCDGLKHSFTSLFATHPPLAERIRRIDPQWDGIYGSRSKPAAAQEPAAATSPGSALDNVGNPGVAHLALAAAMLEGIPGVVREEAHNTMSAMLMIYALLVNLSESATAAKQRAMLVESLEEKDLRVLERIEQEVARVPREKTLTLVDLALPSLKQLSRVQYTAFMKLLSRLILADQHISLFEWCLFKILRYNLDEHPGRRRRAVDLKGLVTDCEVLLSVLAAAGHVEEHTAREAFDAAARKLELDRPLSYTHGLGNNTGELEKALDRLNHVKPLQKPRLLKAMVTCINADGRVTAEESELLRAVGGLLDCPIPPLLPNQRFI